MTKLIGVDQRVRQFGNLQTFMKDEYILSACVDVNTVAADTIAASFIGSYVSENGATLHDLSVCQMGTQFWPATVVLAWLSSSVCPYNFSLVNTCSLRADEILRLPECTGAMRRLGILLCTWAFFT